MKKTLFRICEIDNAGNTYKCYGCFYAESEKDAREIASKYFNNEEISKTGFYEAEMITEKKINEEREKLLKYIDSRT